MLRMLLVALATACTVACGSSDDAQPGSGGTGASGGSGGSAGTAGGSGGSAGTAGSTGTAGSAGAAGSAGTAGSAGAAGAAGAPNGSLQFLGDFETGDLSVWSFSGNDTTHVVQSPVRSGSFAGLMVVSPSDAVPYRSELTAKDGKGVFLDGNEYWIGLSFRMEDWGATLPSWGTIFQTHAVPHPLAGGGGADWSCNAGKNSITVTTSGDQMGLAVVVDPDQSQLPGTAAIATNVWSEKFQLGVWYDWVFRYRPSTAADGIIEAWKNGQKIYTQTGANRFVLDNCNLPATPQTYMKVGIYREKANTSTQTLVYDEVRIFAGENGYSAVAPK